MGARHLGAADQIEAEGVIVPGHAVELEPEHVGRQLGGLLDRHPTHGSETVRHARPLGGPRHGGIRARPDQRRATHGGDADGGRIAAAEQLHVDRRQGRHDAVARHQLHGVQRGPIVGDADIGPGPAVHVFKDEMGNVAARMRPHVADGRKAPVQRHRARRVRAHEPAGSDCGSVVHQTSPVRANCRQK